MLHDVARDGRAILDRNTVRFELKGRFPDAEGERDLSWLDLSMVTDLSPDGRLLVFSESGEGGGPGYGVFLRRTDGAPPVRLGEGMASTLSPDGTWVASMTVLGPPRILLLPTAAGETRALATPGLGDYSGVGWTPDSRTIVFAGRGPSGSLRLHAQTIDGQPAREVAALTLRGARRFPVDPEGGRVAVSSPRVRWPSSASTTAGRRTSRAACAAIAPSPGRRTGNGSTCGADGVPSSSGCP